MSKDQLNSAFGIKNHVVFTEGNGGLLKLVAHHDSGSSVELYLQGAHITSWKDPKGNELLFLSKNSFFKEGKAIRGGIPVIFPQFGPGELPQHGFARASSAWKVYSTKIDDHKNIYVELILSEYADSLKVWPHHFNLHFSFTLSQHSLSNQLMVINNNTENKPFSFTTALHTYYRVSHLHEASILGLKGVEYIDKVDQMKVKKEEAEEKKIAQETDYVYMNTPATLTLRDGKHGRLFVVEKHGFTDAVVWNPWEEKAKTMADFSKEEYLEMICVEAAVVKTPVILQRGEKWVGNVNVHVKH